MMKQCWLTGLQNSAMQRRVVYNWQSCSTWHSYSYSSGTRVHISSTRTRTQTRTRTMSTRIHSTSTSPRPLVSIFVFSLTFPTTTELFKSMQLDSMFYCSLLCLCNMCNTSTHPAENVRCLSLLLTIKINKSSMVQLYLQIKGPCLPMQSCNFTLVCDNILHP